MSPTQRSLAKLRAEGWQVGITERWNQYARVKQDLFGFIDLLAVKGDITLAVQTTSGTNVSHRLEKIRSLPAASNWLLGRDRTLEIHGWAKRGERGQRKLWTCRVLKVALETLM